MIKGRVIMAMSGGVDSSVSAALLKEQGFEVIGVYILGWPGEPDFPCPWQKEEADARAVAEQLGIPFYTINLAKEYEEAVINDFFRNYQAGLTPNPDILCNREVKFKALWQAVRQFEPDYMATGHYAQLRVDRGQKPEYKILKGKDKNKDQTYFLWGIDRAMLPNILFPVGGLEKPKVRQLAKKFKLPTAAKKDSQGICFIGPLKVRSFLARHISAQPGEAVLPDGRVVAQHEGVQYYTIGQRLAAGSVTWTGDVPPLFVIAKDLQKNRLIVGPDQLTCSEELEATQPNWLVEPDGKTFSCLAKIRYRQEDVEATVTLSENQLEVKLKEPVRAITPGQSIVFYDWAGALLGGAIIARVPNQDRVIAKLG